MSDSRCVVLVPYTHFIEPDCETGLRELEAKGYQVRRVRGFAAIDQGRNNIATSALADGFEELMWIDSDIDFKAQDVERLRGHPLPMVCGIYAKKGRRQFACNFKAGTEKVLFGPSGGLIEVDYSGFGFMLTRRKLYETIKEQLRLPECNRKFGGVVVPYFLPMIVPHEGEHWYLAEDYAFCRRASDCGFRIFADTRIRLWHVGTYGFSWEDAGADKERYQTYSFHLAK